MNKLSLNLPMLRLVIRGAMELYYNDAPTITDALYQCSKESCLATLESVEAALLYLQSQVEDAYAEAGHCCKASAD